MSVEDGKKRGGSYFDSKFEEKQILYKSGYFCSRASLKKKRLNKTKIVQATKSPLNFS